MKKRNHFEVVVARGSSTRQIKLLLSENKLINGYSPTMNFAVSKDFRIYLHHHAWHQLLRDDQGLDEDDIIASGNMGIVEGDRFVIRFKNTPGAELVDKVKVKIIAWVRKLDIPFKA